MSITEGGEREAATADQAHRLRQRLEKLNARANAGEPGALGELEAFLKDQPEVLAAAGDLARHAEKAWIDLVVGADSFTRIAVTSQIERLKAELAGPDPSPLEKLLVDHTAIAYLAQRGAELAAVQTGGTIPQAAFRLKKAESAQRRFLLATKSLATLQSLLPQAARPVRGPRLYDPEGRKTG